MAEELSGIETLSIDFVANVSHELKTPMAAELKKYGYKIPPNRIINVGAAIGSHVGPNACGIVYVSE
ncbi:MAG: hypothetical protein ACI4SF_11460 [Oscillospiraceae bacterium]